MSEYLSEYLSEHLDAAWKIAPTFGLAPTQIEILSRSENVVCDVTLPSGKHVAMRFHRHGYNTLDELESEVSWVTALSEADIPVPAAIPTVDGGHYATVELGGQSVYVGVVEWVAGQPLGGPTQAGGAEALDHYHRIGQLSGRIRTHSSIWQRPDTFTRRRWDAAGLLGESPLWGRFWEVDTLSDAQQALFTRARTVLYDKLCSLPTDDEAFGLIHADLHLGNLMADGDELTVIDFDDAGFGWFVYELAVSLHPVVDEPWFDDARAALVAGYRTAYPLSIEEESLIDTFLTIRCLVIIGWLDARKELPIYELSDQLAATAELVATRYLAAHGD